jgi:hypothetical protein
MERILGGDGYTAYYLVESDYHLIHNLGDIELEQISIVNPRKVHRSWGLELSCHGRTNAS